MTSYTLTITVTVPLDAEHLQGAQEIRDEVCSWLDGLGATVLTIEVEEEPT